MSWRDVSLGAVASFINGDRSKNYPSQEDRVAVGIPFVNAADLVEGELRFDSAERITISAFDKLSSGKTIVGDLLFCLRGSPGRVARNSAGVAAIASSLVILRAKPDVDARYLYYHLSGPTFQHQCAALNNGSAQPNVSARALSELPVPLPPLDVQKAIASALGTLDDKIEHNRRMSRALEGLARAMFKAWFVDFEPVHAKAVGATSFPGMPPEAFAALPTTFAGSELGAVPKGWGVGRLGDHCGINLRSVRKGEAEGEIEYVDISSVTVGRLDGVQRMPFADAPSRARRRIAHGDTIWSCVRPNHRSYLFIHSPPDHRLVSTGFAVLSPADFGPSYLHELTTRQEFVDYLVANADGSAYPAVRPEHFAAAYVVVPPQDLRRAFEGLTMPFRDLMAALDQESRKLAELRDYLLPKLLSGVVRVGSANSDAIAGLQEAAS